MADPKDPAIVDDITQEEGVHSHDPSKSPSTIGEEDVGGSAQSPTSDDDVDEALEEVGTIREPGKTLAEEIDEDEKARHTGRAREPEVGEEEDKAA